MDLLRAFASAALVATLAIATVSPSAAQNSSAQPPSSTQSQSAGDAPAAPLPVSLSRIRDALGHEPKLLLPFMSPDTPVFRTVVLGKTLKLEDYWKVRPDTAVGKDVRPAFASTWHNEFMRMTTPSQQVGASVFGLFGNPAMPVGAPMLAIGSAIKSALRDHERAQVRQQIKEELAALDARQPLPKPASTEAGAAPANPPATTAQPATTEPATNKPANNEIKVGPPATPQRQPVH
jgi:hypothetical protein